MFTQKSLCRLNFFLPYIFSRLGVDEENCRCRFLLVFFFHIVIGAPHLNDARCELFLLEKPASLSVVGLWFLEMLGMCATYSRTNSPIVVFRHTFPKADRLSVPIDAITAVLRYHTIWLLLVFTTNLAPARFLDFGTLVD